MRTRPLSRAALAVILAALTLSAGCDSPMKRSQADALRERVMLQHRAFLESAANGGIHETPHVPSDVEAELKEFPNRYAEALRIGGWKSYEGTHVDVGLDLLGRNPAAKTYKYIDQKDKNKEKTETVYERRDRFRNAIYEIEQKSNGNEPADADKARIAELKQQIAELDREIDSLESPKVAMTLERAVRLAVRNNLDIQLARLLPAISDTQVTQAEAVFDAIFFANADFSKLDTPQPDTAFSGFGSTQTDNRQFTTGIRKNTTIGGQFVMQTQFGRQFRDPSIFDVREFRDASLSFSYVQPLLRNFGEDVVTAQIELSKNARLEAVEDLRTRMLQITADTESAYWRLILAKYRVLIQQRLRRVTVRDRDVIKARIDIDATPVDLAEANSFLESRRAELIRAQNELRLASDALKRLINAPELPVSGEELILPLDDAPDAAMKYNLLDAITTALRHRPELQRALLEIKDAAIRERVADNQRLPQLNLSTTVRINGIGSDGIGDAYDTVLEADFVDYIVAAQFEVPIGNRGPQAFWEQRRRESQASVIAYQRAAQQVVLDVKDTLRSVVNAYRIIDATRAARLAAAENIRAIRAQIRGGIALSPDFVDRKLRREGELAVTELAEIQALVDYNNAISRFYQATGTLLERNGIAFNDPLTQAVED